MITSNPVLSGIILIAVAVAFGLIAAALLLNRQEENKKEHPESQAEAVQTPGRIQQFYNNYAMRIKSSLSAPERSADTQTTRAITPDTNQPAAEDGLIKPDPEQSLSAGESGNSTETPVSNKVATIRRHEVSGGIILQVGERYYQNLDELKASPDWSHVLQVYTDLSSWFSHASAPVSRAASEQSMPAKSLRHIKTNSKQTQKTQQPSMIEQINAILQSKTRDSSDPNLSVRLMAGLTGDIRVLIGIHSYSMDEIPNPEIEALIRQCVTEWEQQS